MFILISFTNLFPIILITIHSITQIIICFILFNQLQFQMYYIPFLKRNSLLKLYTYYHITDLYF